MTNIFANYGSREVRLELLKSRFVGKLMSYAAAPRGLRGVVPVIPAVPASNFVLVVGISTAHDLLDEWRFEYLSPENSTPRGLVFRGPACFSTPRDYFGDFTYFPFTYEEFLNREAYNGTY